MKFIRVSPIFTNNQCSTSRNIAIADEINLELENRNILHPSEIQIQSIFEDKNKGLLDHINFSEFITLEEFEVEYDDN